MPEQQQPQQSASKFSSLMNAQFVWFLGHLTTVLCAILYTLSPLFQSLTSFYRKAFMGVLLSYGIVLYKLYGTPKFNKMYWMKLTNDENLQYMLLALVWMTSPPIFILLLPYTIFSFFHSLEYAVNVLFPLYVPNPSESQKDLVAKAKSFISTYQPITIQFIAKLEVAGIFPLLLILIIFRRASFIQPFIFAQFLRFRYVSSPLVQREFTSLRLSFDSKLLGNDKVPAFAQNVYVKIRDFLIKIGSDPNLAAQQQQKNN
ncbi:hypothetical protein BCR32DRAFT_291903 [Anaeromyces robustus]|uniref:Uncharacterized protein n=1 Tax=Anaeromyces robustus TaxID=1754192 RepID=A0A1Y1XCS8_9FUNG|nr:hypothetical protein BCR32DRAFT_291903 [Anaeromyces robustus]|eukprot:ORX83580.1 hypothetical protein BCR32DRAFT_291903 [Anaeromyces robustus]